MSADKKLIARRMELAAARERKAKEWKQRHAQRVAQGVAEAVDESEGNNAAEGEDDDIWNQVPEIDIDLVDEDQYWTQHFEPHMPGDPSDDTSAHDEDRARDRRISLTKIVRFQHTE